MLAIVLCLQAGHLHAQDSIRWIEGRTIGLQGQAGKQMTREHFYDLYIKQSRQDKWKWTGVPTNFIHGKKLLGEDSEATVDGIHYTDTGFKR